MTLSLPIEHEANELLSRDGFALLLAMMLDQQVPFEKAFSSPYELTLRLGHEPSAQEIAEFDPDALAAIFAERPALHRFPRAMAARAQELARIVTDRYDGDASAVWATAKDARRAAARGWPSCPASAPTRPRSRSRCSASSSASSRRAGARPPVTSARMARTTRSPTSATTPRSWPCGPTRRR